MQRPFRLELLCGAFLVALAACDGGSDGPLTIDQTAVVAGRAYFDRDLDGQMTGSDAPVAGVAVALELDPTGHRVAQTTTRDDGTFLMANIPAGRYSLVASRGSAGDTLDVLHVESPIITLAAGDSVQRLVRLGYPRVSAAAFGSTPPGRRVSVAGIALNGWGTFGDSTLHVRDATGAVRAVQVEPIGVAAGDSVQVSGTTGVQNGQPVLTRAVAGVQLRAVGVPVADSVSTAAAASAGGGARGGDQVRVVGVITGSQTLPGGDLLFNVDDGSGRVEVVFDRDVTIGGGPYVPGVALEVTGLLVPTATGTWQLKPRGTADVHADYATVSVAEARALPAGRTVYIQGLALNGWSTFGDSTVHVADASGAIRVTSLPQYAVFAGDSVRVLGTVAVMGGQPVLRGFSIAVLLAGVGVPAPVQISVGEAATARNGALDAAFVRTSGVVSAVSGGGAADVLLVLSAGLGEVVVRLDRDVGFQSSAYPVGTSLTVRGVLVPSLSGTGWELKPRAPADITIP